MLRFAIVTAGLLLGFTATAEAGCVTGAVAGAVVGRLAGHHGVAGAAVGCAVGHHQAVKAKDAQQQQKNDQK